MESERDSDENGDESDSPWIEELAQIHRARTGKDFDPFDIRNAPHFFNELINLHSNFRGGNWLALLDVLSICSTYRLPLPFWASGGFQDFVVSSVKGEVLGKKGRSNSPLARTVEAAKRRKRAEVFEGIRNFQTNYLDNPMPQLYIPKETLDLMHQGVLHDLGKTREDALRITEISLRGTFAQASLATLKKMMTSYLEEYTGFEVSHPTQVALGFENDDLPLWLAERDETDEPLFFEDSWLGKIARPSDKPT